MTDIDWQQWAVRQVRLFAAQASDLGSDYLNCDCPVCGRRRLEPLDDRVQCEKCGWTLSTFDGGVTDYD